MAKLTKEEVLKLSALSRLKLSDEEVEKFRTDLSEILSYVEMLDKADIAGVEPTYQLTGLKNVMRKDVVKKYQADTKDLLKNAPAIEKDQFKVKRVL